MKKQIVLQGKNKLEIRKQVQEIENKGILVKRCVKVQDHKTWIKMYFEVEEQWGELKEINIENKNNIVNIISDITKISKKELTKVFNNLDKEILKGLPRRLKRSEILEARTKLIENLLNQSLVWVYEKGNYIIK